MEKTDRMRCCGMEKSNKSQSLKTHTFERPTFQTGIINPISNIKSTMDIPLNHIRYIQRSRSQSLKYPKSDDFNSTNFVAIYDEHLPKYTQDSTNCDLS